MTILDEIIEYKKKEVESCKSLVSIDELKTYDGFKRETLSLKSFLTAKDKTGIIAEFKRQSPSKGIINDKVKVEDVTTGYAQAGASALSVLTDFNFFGGAVDDLLKARAVNNIPILRKDFTVDDYQIYEARAIGADAILLIAACLTPEEVKHFTELAHSLQLEVLLELHAEEELEYVFEGIDVVGVNNRNLKTFEVNLEHSIALAKQLPKEMVRISESGISTVENIQYLKNEGFQGFLIGENFMKTDAPGMAFKEFVNQLA